MSPRAGMSGRVTAILTAEAYHLDMFSNLLGSHTVLSVLFPTSLRTAIYYMIRKPGKSDQSADDII
jgi:hypothetical protein